MNALIQQIRAFWQKQKTSQKITLVALLVAAVVLIPILISWATRTTYNVAFSGLSESDAAAVVNELSAQGIDYKLNGSSTILVPSNQVYEVRLKMASAGLPKTGSSVGYELFDSSSLGMTEFTQKVNYQRAVEGELVRTIGSLNAIEAVSVHIVIPEKTLLTSVQKEPTASIMVKTKAGAVLDLNQVKAITHLVAASIEGLKAENVVVVDSDGNMLASGSATGVDAAAAAVSDSRRTAELAVAKDIQRKAQQMLDSVLGPDKAIVQANVTLDWTQREVTSNSFDPTPAAIRSSQITTESYSTDGSTAGGVPGATSNLPTAVATTTGGTTGVTSYQRTDTTTNYEVTSTQSREIIEPGQIKQVSVSVLVDSITDPTQMDVLRSAVSAAVGIDAARGDSLSVESIVFDRTYYTDQAEEMTKAAKNSSIIKYVEIGGAVLLFVVLLLYIQRLLKNLKLATSDAWVPVMKNVSENSLRAPVMAPLISATVAAPQIPVPAPIVEMAPRPTISAEDEQMQKVLTRLSEDSPASVAEIIQLWLAEDEK